MNAKKKAENCPAKTVMAPLPLVDVKSRIVLIRQLPVIIDADVAELYGVETKRVNEAVRNNPDKFPQDYMFELNARESRVLRSKISTLKPSGKGQHSKFNFKAFTEKGLYMLATILKGNRQDQAHRPAHSKSRAVKSGREVLTFPSPHFCYPFPTARHHAAPRTNGDPTTRH